MRGESDAEACQKAAELRRLTCLTKWFAPAPTRTSTLGLNPQDANDNDAFIAETWAQEGLVILEENMVTAKLVHRDFQNEIIKFGDVVNTRRPGTFKIKRKVDGTTLTQQDANATSVHVPLDQWFYNSFTIEDGEGSKSFQELVDMYLLPAMQTIARGVDRAALIVAAHDPMPLIPLLRHCQAGFQYEARLR